MRFPEKWQPVALAILVVTVIATVVLRLIDVIDSRQLGVRDEPKAVGIVEKIESALIEKFSD